MWWGGAEPPPDNMDAVATEAGTAAVEAGGADEVPGPSNVQQELQNLQEQFASQQQLLGSLKNRLPRTSNVHQDYATRLAAMRSRLGRTQLQKFAKHHSQEKELEPNAPQTDVLPEPEPTTESVDPTVSSFEIVHHDVSLSNVFPEATSSKRFGGSLVDIGSSSDQDHREQFVSLGEYTSPNIETRSEVAGFTVKKTRTASFSETSSNSKMQLLRKQLDQNRSKFEKQLRDKKEKKATLDEMKKKVDKLRMDIEERDKLIQDFEKGIVTQQTQATTQQLCQQLLQKDAIMLSLSSRVSQLETLAQEQKEQIEEKNSIIEARTEAVALVTKDKDDRLLKLMEDLEERQCSMSSMQEEFTAKEQEWINEKKTLRNLVSDKSRIVSVLEENNKRIENVRSELSTRNAELQEKLDILQSERSDLSAQLSNEKAKSLESQNMLKELKQKLNNAEAHGRNKLKNLEKQIRTWKSDDDADLGSKIIELHNQIALLEEEKGNLQLRLVDFDELKSFNSSLEKEVALLSTKVEGLNKMIDRHSSTMSALENEKSFLIEKLNDRDMYVLKLEDGSKTLQDLYDGLCGEKADMEKKFKGLNDAHGSLQLDYEKLQQELQESKTELGSKHESVFLDEKQSLERQIEELSLQVSSLKEKCASCDAEVAEFKRRCEQAESTQRDTADDNQRLLAILTDKEDRLTNCAIEKDSTDALISKLKNMEQDLESRLKESEESSGKLSVEVANIKACLKGKEQDLERRCEEIKCLTKELSDSKAETLVLKSEANNLADTVSRADKEVSSLNETLREFEKNVKLFKKESDYLERCVSELKAEKENLLSSLSSFESRVGVLESSRSQLEELLEERNTALQTKETELSVAVRGTAQQEQVNEALKSEVDQLCEEKQSLLLQLSSVKSDYEENYRKLQDSYELIRQELQGNLENCQAKLEESKSELKELQISDVQLQDIIADKELQIGTLDARVCQLICEVDACKSESNSYVEALRQNESELQNYAEALELRKSELSSRDADIESRDKIITDLQNQLTVLREQLTAAEENIAMTEHDTMETVETHRQAAEEACSQLEVKVAELTDIMQKLTTTESVVLSLQEELKVRDEEAKEHVTKLTSLEEEYSKLLAKFDELNGWYEQVTSDYSALQAELATKIEEAEMLRASVSEKSTEMKGLESKVASLTSDLESKLTAQNKADGEKQSLLENLQDELATEKQELEKLRQYTEQLVQCQTQWEAWAVTVAEEKTNLQQSVEASEARVQELQQLLQEHTLVHENIEVSETQAVELQHELSGELRDELEAVQKEKQASEKKLQKMEETVHALQQEKVQLEEIRQDLQKKLLVKEEELRKELMKGQALQERNVQQSLTSHGSSNEGSRSSSRLSDHKDERQLRLEQSQEQCRELQSQLSEALLRITQLETSVATCTRAADDRSGSIGDDSQLGEVDLNDSLSSSPTSGWWFQSGATTPEILRLQQTINEKVALIEQMQEQLSMLKNSLHSQKEETALISEAKQSYEKRYKEVQGTCDLLRLQLSERSHLAEESDATIAQLQNQVTDLKRQMQEAAVSHQQHLQEQLCEQASVIQSLNALSAQQQERIQQLENLTPKSEAPELEGEEESPVCDFVPGSEKAASSLFSSNDAAAVDWLSLTTEVSQSESKLGTVIDETNFSRPIGEQQTEVQGPRMEGEQDKILDETSELQYRLAWYEEQWPAFTTHYTSLQLNYSDTEAKIAELILILAEIEPSLEDTEIKSQLPVLSRLEMKINTVVSSFSAQSLKVKELEMKNNSLIAEIMELKSFTKNDGSVDPLGAEDLNSELLACKSELNLCLTNLSSVRSELNDIQEELAKARDELLQSNQELKEAQQRQQQLQDENLAAEQQFNAAVSDCNSRISELELIVGSAENEITRLRSQSIAMQEERKQMLERIVTMEADLLADQENSASVDQVQQQHLQQQQQQLQLQQKQLDQMQRENLTLRSELEVMEGENSRRCTDVDILESECARLRVDFEMALQSTQMLEAEKDSLVLQMRTLEREKELLQSDSQAIEMDRQELAQQLLLVQKKLCDVQSLQQVQRPAPSGADVGDIAVEELDWGCEASKEQEHYQRSSSHDASLQAELAGMREQLIAAEKEKNSLSDELQASKVKCGKLLQKFKAAQAKNEELRKDVEKLRGKKVGGGGSLSDLDKALEDEYKAQVLQAQAETEELKQRLEEVLTEKDQMTKQCEVLKDAHERFVEMKEDQDDQICMFKARNRELESKVSSMEWRISELEEFIEEEQSGRSDTRSAPEMSLVSPREASVRPSSAEPSTSAQHVKNLTDQILALENQLDELSSSNMKVESVNKDLTARVAQFELDNLALQEEKLRLESQLQQVKENNVKTAKDIDVYKEAFIQQQQQFEKLTDEKSIQDKEVQKLEYEKVTLSAEYNAAYEELLEIRKDQTAMKYEYNILAGERDRLRDDIELLTAELEAFRQEKLEDTVRALEEEITELRGSVNALKEEATVNEVQHLTVQDELDRLRCELQYSHSAQEDMRERIGLQEQERRENSDWANQLQRRNKYCEAETSALSSANKKLTEELKESGRKVAELEQQLRHWLQQSQHLSRQVEAADASLTRLSEASLTAADGGAELEAAIAAMHLRDLRCHHLVMEIHKLVEERDALQLRLSSALRSNEELQKQVSISPKKIICDEDVLQTAGAPAAASGDDSEPQSLSSPLHSKLMQLRELNSEVEQKTMANIPPSPFLTDIVSSPSIVTPDYTLSKETQATSSTLMNWIMGRTSPKVMHV